MKEELVTFETAKLAKEKGFNIPVLNCYNDNEELGDNDDNIYRNWNLSKTDSHSHMNIYSAPTQSLLQKWLREKHKLGVSVDCSYMGPENYSASLCGYGKRGIFMDVLRDGFTIYNNYEKALEEGLQEALKLIKS